MKRSGKNKRAIMAAVILILTVQPLCQAYGSEDAGIVERTGSRSGMAAEESEMVFDQLQGKKEAETELVGNIKVTLISAALPSDMDFTVDPEAEFDAVTRPDGQIISPQGLSVTNHSVVPVKVEIASVDQVSPSDVTFAEKYPGGPSQDFALVGTIAETEVPGRAILVLGRRNQTYTSSREFEQYAICPGKTGIPVAEIGAEDTVELQVYGKAAADFYGAYQFTVRPTLKISTVKAQ
ncbi:MAG: hypothetical protein KHZ58_14915 [Hungatella hathewayi]|nr:hypothetical protein [Hungatella hathewayi]